jgi:hypothetical protein
MYTKVIKGKPVFFAIDTIFGMTPNIRCAFIRINVLYKGTINFDCRPRLKRVWFYNVPSVNVYLENS